MNYHRSVPRHAFTLTELLVTLAIIALLGALLYPVLAEARADEGDPLDVCARQLGQVGRAFAAYIEDYDGARPKRLVHLVPDHIDAPLLVCSADPHVEQGGWAGLHAAKDHGMTDSPWDIPLSYFYPDLVALSDEWWEKAKSLEGRPGYAVCVVHGEAKPMPSGCPAYQGLVLRLCFDGSVVQRNCVPEAAMEDYWLWLTDQPSDDPSERRPPRGCPRPEAPEAGSQLPQASDGSVER